MRGGGLVSRAAAADSSAKLEGGRGWEAGLEAFLGGVPPPWPWAAAATI